MFGAEFSTSERTLVGIAAALLFAVCYIAGMQLGGHW
jgi:hypothetical protein